MKKLLAILLAAVMCISFCACSMSKEDMLSNAIDVHEKEILNQLNENLVIGKEIYNGKIAKFTDLLVTEITNYGFEAKYRYTFSNGGFTTLTTMVYLSKDDILTLHKGDTVSVVGELKVVSDITVKLKNAYLI